MKIIARFDNGYETELREIQGLNKDCEVVIVKSMVNYHKKDLEDMEKQLSEKFNRKVIILGGHFTEVLVIPKNHGRSMAHKIINSIFRK